MWILCMPWGWFLAQANQHHPECGYWYMQPLSYGDAHVITVTNALVGQQSKRGEIEGSHTISRFVLKASPYM